MDRSQFQFDEYRLDAVTGALHRAGQRVPLEAQPARLLILLVTRAGEVVSRDDIRVHLWGDTVVSYDQSINYSIRRIRVALGASCASLVETVPRQGYRFTGPPHAGSKATRPAYRLAAACLTAGIAVGYGLGGVNPQRQLAARSWRFVYSHVTAPANCPYLRLLTLPHRDS